MGSEERFDYWRRTIGLVAAPVVFVVFLGASGGGSRRPGASVVGRRGRGALDDGSDSAGRDGTAGAGAVCVARDRFCQGNLSRFCRSDRFPFSWQLSDCGSDVAARAEPAHSVWNHTRRRDESEAAARGIWDRYWFRFTMGVQYGDDGHDVPDRAGDPQRKSNATSIWNGADVDDGVRRIGWRPRDAGGDAAEPDWLGIYFRTAAAETPSAAIGTIAGPGTSLSRDERNVLIAFLLTVGLWITLGVIALTHGADDPVFRWFNARLPEAMASLFGAILLFVLPTDWRRGQSTLSWRNAANIDWGTILLFGGGLALGELMFSTGLAKWMGAGIARELQADTVLGLMMLSRRLARSCPKQPATPPRPP
jgi:Sodium:sulfate symporter transmembrane region